MSDEHLHINEIRRRAEVSTKQAAELRAKKARRDRAYYMALWGVSIFLFIFAFCLGFIVGVWG